MGKLQCLAVLASVAGGCGSHVASTGQRMDGSTYIAQCVPTRGDIGTVTIETISWTRYVNGTSTTSPVPSVSYSGVEYRVGSILPFSFTNVWGGSTATPGWGWVMPLTGYSSSEGYCTAEISFEAASADPPYQYDRFPMVGTLKWAQ